MRRDARAKRRPSRGEPEIVWVSSPSVIIGHHGWGEMLNLGDVWPGCADASGYYEFYYNMQRRLRC